MAIVCDMYVVICTNHLTRPGTSVPTGFDDDDDGGGGGFDDDDGDGDGDGFDDDDGDGDD